MAIANLHGKTEIVATKVMPSPQGESPFYGIAEVHFPSMEALQRCAESAGGKETLANAVKISSGGPLTIEALPAKIGEAKFVIAFRPGMFFEAKQHSAVCTTSTGWRRWPQEA